MCAGECTRAVCVTGCVFETQQAQQGSPGPGVRTGAPGACGARRPACMWALRRAGGRRRGAERRSSAGAPLPDNKGPQLMAHPDIVPRVQQRVPPRVEEQTRQTNLRPGGGEFRPEGRRRGTLSAAPRPSRGAQPLGASGGVTGSVGGSAGGQAGTLLLCAALQAGLGILACPAHPPH